MTIEHASFPIFFWPLLCLGHFLVTLQNGIDPSPRTLTLLSFPDCAHACMCYLPSFQAILLVLELLRLPCRCIFFHASLVSLKLLRKFFSAPSILNSDASVVFAWVLGRLMIYGNFASLGFQVPCYIVEPLALRMLRACCSTTCSASFSGV